MLIIANQISNSQSTSFDSRTTNIIGWLLFLVFACFSILMMIRDKFEPADGSSDPYWSILSMIYKNTCYFATTFGGLCILYSWYNSVSKYNPIPSSLQDSQIKMLNTEITNNTELLSLQNVNNLPMMDALSQINTTYDSINSIQSIGSLDSSFFVSGTNFYLAQGCLSSIQNIINQNNNNGIQDFINVLYTNVVLFESLYNYLDNLYESMENWNYKSVVKSKLLDLIYKAQSVLFQSSVKPIALQTTIFHASHPIVITQSGSSISTSFKDVINTSRIAGSKNTITLSRSVTGTPSVLSWNLLYPLSLYNIKASQGYFASTLNNYITNTLFQDICSYNSPFLESDFKNSNFIKQLTIKDQSGLTVYNSLDLDSTYIYSDQNGLVILENKGFVPSNLTFYYISNSMLVVESYIATAFTDSSLSNTNIMFSLQSKTFYNYSNLPKDNNSNAYLSNNNFQIYFNSQLNQLGYLSLIGSVSPFTLVKTLLSPSLAYSITYPNPSNVSYPYQTRRSQSNNGTIVVGITNVNNIYNLLLSAI